MLNTRIFIPSHSSYHLVLEAHEESHLGKVNLEIILKRYHYILKLSSLALHCVKGAKPELRKILLRSHSHHQESITLAPHLLKIYK